MRGLAVLFAAWFSACSGGDDCSGLDDPENLWARTARVRVDVYGASVQCDRLPAAPLLSRLYSPAENIALDLHDGQYAIVLTLFADAEATQALGSACERDRFDAGSHTCLRFHLQSTLGGDDGGVTCTCSGDAGVCCAEGCVDPTNDPANCGACGILCGEHHTEAVCRNGFCSQTCEAGWARCNGDSGCDTNLATAGLKLCGSRCVSAASCCMADDCAFPPAPASCFVPTCSGPGGECSYPMIPGAAVCGPVCCIPEHAQCANDCTPSCALGWQNCDHAAETGCECEGDGCCAGGCQVKHDNGVGQSFFDCAPQNTFNQNQASAACAAFTGDPAACHVTLCGGGQTAICSDGSSQACDCWVYEGSGKGLVRTNPAGTCNCKSGTGAAWY